MSGEDTGQEVGITAVIHGSAVRNLIIIVVLHQEGSDSCSPSETFAGRTNKNSASALTKAIDLLASSVVGSGSFSSTCLLLLASNLTL